MRLARILALAAAALLVPLLAACGGSTTGAESTLGGPQPAGGAPLAGTSWVLTDAPLTGDIAASGITITFAETDVSGSSGVNTYVGGFTSTADGSLQFEPLATTRMAGEEAAMALEQEYLAALQSTFGYTVDGATLALFGAADQVLTYRAA